MGWFLKHTFLPRVLNVLQTQSMVDQVIGVPVECPGLRYSWGDVLGCSFPSTDRWSMLVFFKHNEIQSETGTIISKTRL